MSDYLPPKVCKSLFTKEAMWDSLPHEIPTHVLIRLPIKSIVTCTSVYKTWKSLIQNPTFISMHLHQSSNNNNHPLLLFRQTTDQHEKEHYALHWDDNENFYEHTRFGFPFHDRSPCEIYRVVGTCNGLICLADDFYVDYHKFILWNPCVRKFVELPQPNITFHTHGGHDASVGFGFDSKTNDYKVVRFLTFLDKDDWDYESPPDVEVYSLAMGELKTLTTLPPTRVVTFCDPLAFLNGSLQEIKDLGIVGNCHTFVDSYVESIVLLDKPTVHLRREENVGTTTGKKEFIMALTFMFLALMDLFSLLSSLRTLSYRLCFNVY
ncbi:F-box protein CPR1 [Quercus suber]|uniref:F-box protein CPR1 n=1 Tax=Quercus suber TaxID=58331 RepID=UPI000CE1E73E|nr:F-box protein CPR1-like [Quercus suber]